MPATNSLLRGLRSLAAVVGGYAVIALGTLLTFEIWLGGIAYASSPPSVLTLATCGAFASGLAGGLTAGLIAGRRPLAHAAGVLVPVALDTGWVILSGVSKDPVWFDLGGSLVLMIAALAGGWWLERRRPALA